MIIDGITKSASQTIRVHCCGLQTVKVARNEGGRMRIIGCDLHSRQQTLAMLNVETGEVEECVLCHEGDKVRRFYQALPRPVRVGIEATGSMQWFLELMET